jgi:hypothetical protein
MNKFKIFISTLERIQNEIISLNEYIYLFIFLIIEYFHHLKGLPNQFTLLNSSSRKALVL